ncbi:hypothetical protein WJ972_04190 [Achromobacter insuavis]
MTRRRWGNWSRGSWIAAKHATFIDAALDLMDDATYAATLRQAWQRALRGPATEGVAEVLDSAALQWPQLFAGHWPALLAAAEAGAGGPRFNTDQAWRALDAETARAWLAQLPPTIEADSPDQLRARARCTRVSRRRCRARGARASGAAWIPTPSIG